VPPVVHGPNTTAEHFSSTLGNADTGSAHGGKAGNERAHRRWVVVDLGVSGASPHHQAHGSRTGLFARVPATAAPRGSGMGGRGHQTLLVSTTMAAARSLCSGALGTEQRIRQVEYPTGTRNVAR